MWAREPSIIISRYTDHCTRSLFLLSSCLGGEGGLGYPGWRREGESGSPIPWSTGLRVSSWPVLLGVSFPSDSSYRRVGCSPSCPFSSPVHHRTGTWLKTLPSLVLRTWSVINRKKVHVKVEFSLLLTNTTVVCMSTVATKLWIRNYFCSVYLQSILAQLASESWRNS